MYKNKLKEVRNIKKISQSDIANFLNIHRARYCQYETEKDIMPIDHLNSVSNYFDISLDYLFEFSSIIRYSQINTNIDCKISAQRLKELRKENSLTQDKLAKMLNSAKTTISGYERGARIIATPFLYTICKTYNISADYLLGKINEPKYLK